MNYEKFYYISLFNNCKFLAENIYAYHFRAPLPIDITKVGSFGNKITPYVDGWDSYERCEYLSCHASDLSYMFETENQLDCNQVSFWIEIEEISVVRINIFKYTFGHSYWIIFKIGNKFLLILVKFLKLMLLRVKIACQPGIRFFSVEIFDL